MMLPSLPAAKLQSISAIMVVWLGMPVLVTQVTMAGAVLRNRMQNCFADGLGRFGYFRR
jgi:hypothetical protein